MAGKFALEALHLTAAWSAGGEEVQDIATFALRHVSPRSPFDLSHLLLSRSLLPPPPLSLSLFPSFPLSLSGRVGNEQLSRAAPRRGAARKCRRHGNPNMCHSRISEGRRVEARPGTPRLCFGRKLAGVYSPVVRPWVEGWPRRSGCLPLD